MEKNGKGLYSILCGNSSCEGILNIPHNLQIDGKFSGKIEVGETIYVGVTADVCADIIAKNAIIGGSIKGNIIVENRLEMESKSILIGNLKARELVINEGAIFHGTSYMKDL